MLISRNELAFDFKGARFDLSHEEDRKFLKWVFDQFLYGEVTGIQCGYWLFHAPHLNAATFLSKQAGEELSHVRKILRIFSILGEKPGPAHPAIRFLSTGMMGGSWGEHVTLEMALGEGLVLTAFYALADTIDQPEIKKILESAILEEERHVVFGESETQKWLSDHPEDRKFLLAQAYFQVVALRFLRRFIAKKLQTKNKNHPVLQRFPEFFTHTIRQFETRIERLKLYEGKLTEMSTSQVLSLLVTFPFYFIKGKLTRKGALLTKIYLQDPVVKNEAQRQLERSTSVTV